MNSIRCRPPLFQTPGIDCVVVVVVFVVVVVVLCVCACVCVFLPGTDLIPYH